MHVFFIGGTAFRQFYVACAMACRQIALGFVLTTLVSIPGLADSIDVEVEVNGLRSADGRILVALHDDRWAFPSRWERAVVSASVAATEGSATIPQRLPRSGQFALIVVHDEDDDGRMKKNFLGLPQEGYATGRNAQSLEFPLFAPARRDWTDGKRVSVRLRYP